MMEPYLSFMSSYPSSSPPLQQALSKQHQGGSDDDHQQFMHQQNATSFLGLTPPDMEVPVAAPPSTAENKSLSAGVVEVKETERPKTTKKTTKKPKYAFQTRSHVDILDDGYRWRKYGQKAVKNNKFPRSYYRCTYQGCNVKKQVQRLTGDEGVVVTTYEGIHSHAIEKSTDNFEHILSQFQIYTNI